MTTLKFLLLEDSPNDVELVSTMLTNSDLTCEFVVVETKEDFQRALQSESIDLALIDYSLPTFTGIEAIQLAHTQFPLIPCILVSGVLGEERAVEALKSGAANYVLKQRLERLVPAVERALKEAEEKRLFARAINALRKNESLFRGSVESMPDCLAILSTARDREGNVQDFVVEYINEMAEKYLLVSSDEYAGKSFYSLLPSLKNIENNYLFSEFCFVIENGRPYRDEICLGGWERKRAAVGAQPIRRQTAIEQALNDQFVAIEIKAAGLDDGLVVTWSDITQRKMLEQQSLELVERAEVSRRQAVESSQYRDDMLARFSHELRSPISNISGSLQLLEINQQSAELRDKVLEVIQRNAQALEYMASHLLDGSRIDRGELQCNLEPIDCAQLNAIVLDAIDSANAFSRTKSVQISFEPPASLSGKLSGDPARLQQAIHNLLSNAIKFTPAQGEVTLDVYSQAQTVSISVKDTGKGMSADFAAHAFDQRWQMEHPSNTAKSGMGLGLPIVKHIVDAHGGQVSAQSDGIDRGSIFTVELPLLAATDTAVETTSSVAINADQPVKTEGSSASSRSALGIAADSNMADSNIAESDAADSTIRCSLKHVRVLVVDDQVDSVDVCRMMLEIHNAEIEEATTADEALKIVRAFRPHVIVSDLAMPGKDGYEMIRQIRALPDYEGGAVPAIAVSAYTTELDRTRALLAGFQLHIAKPIDLNDLVEAVALLVDRFEPSRIRTDRYEDETT